MQSACPFRANNRTHALHNRYCTTKLMSLCNTPRLMLRIKLNIKSPGLALISGRRLLSRGRGDMPRDWRQ